MSFCFPHHLCSCFQHDSYCPFPQWLHPLMCNPAHLCCAGEEDNGPTLVIHKILLEPCGNQSCTPRTFYIRITGPSYPCGETFSLRAGSCTEVDEPLVITGLTPGQYEIEEINANGCECGGWREYDTTYTGPISGNCVSITNSRVPTVITIVNRKRFARRRRRGCHSCCSGSQYGSC